MARLGEAAHDVLVADCALGPHGVGRLVDFPGERLGSGKAEHVVDAVFLAPGHRLGPRVVPVAAKQDARHRPAGSDTAHEPAQMSANLDARGRLAGTQDDRDRPALLGVIDMDRQKAALVVVGVEQRELLMAMEVSLIAVSPHGIGDEPIPPSIEDMAADRLPAILNAQPKGPYRLAGHCVGGIVALETARLLITLDHKVEAVVMVDAPLMIAGEVSRYREAASGSQRAASNPPVAAACTRGWLRR